MLALAGVDTQSRARPHTIPQDLTSRNRIKISTVLPAHRLQGLESPVSQGRQQQQHNVKSTKIKSAQAALWF